MARPGGLPAFTLLLVVGGLACTPAAESVPLPSAALSGAQSILYLLPGEDDAVDYALTGPEGLGPNGLSAAPDSPMPSALLYACAPEVLGLEASQARWQQERIPCTVPTRRRYQLVYEHDQPLWLPSSEEPPSPECSRCEADFLEVEAQVLVRAQESRNTERRGSALIDEERVLLALGSDGDLAHSFLIASADGSQLELQVESTTSSVVRTGALWVGRDLRVWSAGMGGLWQGRIMPEPGRLRVEAFVGPPSSPADNRARILPLGPDGRTMLALTSLGALYYFEAERWHATDFAPREISPDQPLNHFYADPGLAALDDGRVRAIGMGSTVTTNEDDPGAHDLLLRADRLRPLVMFELSDGAVTGSIAIHQGHSIAAVASRSVFHADDQGLFELSSDLIPAARASKVLDELTFVSIKAIHELPHGRLAVTLNGGGLMNVEVEPNAYRACPLSLVDAHTRQPIVPGGDVEEILYSGDRVVLVRAPSTTSSNVIFAHQRRRADLCDLPAAE